MKQRVVVVVAIILFWSFWGLWMLFITSPSGAHWVPSFLSYPPVGEKQFDPSTLGFIFFVWKDPPWLLREELALVRGFVPGASVYIVSDNGDDYSQSCKEYLDESAWQPAVPPLPRGAVPRCHFHLDPIRLCLANFWLPGCHMDKGSLFLWAERWVRAVRWLNTTWVVQHEIDVLVLRLPLAPPPNVDFMERGNRDQHIAPEFREAVRSKCGFGPVGQGSQGGFTFRSEAFLDAWAQRVKNSPEWIFFDRYMGPGAEVGTFGLLLLSCKIGIKWMELVNGIGGGGVPVTENETFASWRHWFKMFRMWPHGPDLSDCFDCLRVCQERHCETYVDEANDGFVPKVVGCVIRRRCQCPAFMHNMKGGLCGGRAATEYFNHSATFRREEINDSPLDWSYHKRVEKLEVCLGFGLCSASVSSAFRQLSLFVHIAGILGAGILASWSSPSCSLHWIERVMLKRWMVMVMAGSTVICLLNVWSAHFASGDAAA